MLSSYMSSNSLIVVVLNKQCNAIFRKHDDLPFYNQDCICVISCSC